MCCEWKEVLTQFRGISKIKIFEETLKQKKRFFKNFKTLKIGFPLLSMILYRAINKPQLKNGVKHVQSEDANNKQRR